MSEQTILSSNEKSIVVRVVNDKDESYIVKKYFKKSFRSEIFKKQRTSITKVNEIDLISIEIRILSSFKNDNLIHLIKEVDINNTSMDLIMEDAGSPLNFNQYFTRSTLNKYLKQIFNGLKYLHDHRIIHGDFKPDNILINPITDKLKICDFGSSIEFKNVDDDTLFKFPISTPSFYSPEYCSKSLDMKPYGTIIHGKPLDIWSLGMTIHLLTFKKFPFPTTDVSIIQLCKSIIRYQCGIPRGFSVYGDLIVHALEKDPKKRWSIEEIIEYFETVYVF